VLDGDLEAARRAVVGVLDDVARWIVAVPGGNSASELELETGRAVMAMGGFTGSDNAPTLEQLPALVAADELRFVAVGDDGGRPDAGSSSISAWVTSACTAVSVDGSSSTVYDCAGAVTG
jgi:4-amino-4-deoxy-L-arabinose transferase-like glycosyltransferase